jgi:hypothetical protein
VVGLLSCWEYTAVWAKGLKKFLRFSRGTVWITAYGWVMQLLGRILWPIIVQFRCPHSGPTFSLHESIDFDTLSIVLGYNNIFAIMGHWAL